MSIIVPENLPILQDKKSTVSGYVKCGTYVHVTTGHKAEIAVTLTETRECDGAFL
jgi:hypothetical protein